MGRVKTAREFAKEAGIARSDLNIFAGVMALMESSLVSHDCFVAEARIVVICKAEMQRCLRRMDAAFAKHDRLTRKVSHHGR